MKKIALLLFVIVLGLVVFNIFSTNSDDKKIEQVKKPTTETIEVFPESIYSGNLLLINKDHPMEQSAIPQDIIKVADYPEESKDFALADPDIQVSQKMLSAFQLMVLNAKDDGVSHFIINSSYRSFEQQKVLYETKGKDIALPAGSSEHNLGLSMDIGSTLGLMENADEGKWLANNAYQYGFILRYPSDKTAITGIKYEAWHFRYVGTPHSFIMKNHNWVLEEYIDYLKTHKMLTEDVNGTRYTVQYHAVNEEGVTKIKIPLQKQYMISGTNDDGIIVTYWPKPQQDTTTDNSTETNK